MKAWFRVFAWLAVAASVEWILRPRHSRFGHWLIGRSPE